MRLPEWCQTHSLKDFLTLLEEDCKTNNYLGSIEPNKGKNMNEQINDVAFEPMDATTAVDAKVADGTVRIVEGDEFLDGRLVKKGEPVGYIQIVDEEAPKN